jgi:hypothetical protein
MTAPRSPACATASARKNSAFSVALGIQIGFPVRQTKPTKPSFASKLHSRQTLSKPSRSMSGVPQTRAPQRSSVVIALPIETPERAPVPFQLLAVRPKYLWSAGCEAVGLGQDARRGELRRHTLLGEPVFSDVFACDQDNHIVVA